MARARASFWRGLLAAALVAAAFAGPARAEPPEARALWDQAVSLVQAGEAGEAIPILERLVTDLPDAATVRLELGLAYFLTGVDDKARYHIARAMTGELRESERAGAQELLARIEARRPWGFSFGIALVPQTNTGRRTSAQTVTIGGLPFVLNESPDPGVGLALSGRFVYLPRLTERLRGRLVLSLGGNVYERRALNDYTFRAEGGLLRREGRAELGAGLAAAQRWVGDSRYTHEVGLYGTATLRPDDSRQLSMRLEVARREAPTRPALEATLARLSLGAEQGVSPRLSVYGRGFATLTDAAAPHESGRMLGMTLGASYLFDGGWRTSLEATASRDLRDGPTPLFAVTRRETELRLVGRVLNRQLQVRGYAPVLEIGHERRRSTLPIAEFRNSFVSVGLERAF